MNLKNKVNIHNRFDIEIRDSKTGELKKSITSFNIVLNQMYTRLCGGSSYFVNIHFGSGTGTLAAIRTTLFSHLGTKVAVDEEIIKAIPLSTWKRKVVLNPEEFVGNTISEVGIAYGATNTNLVTHSLLKDSEGNPISIIKTDVDVITIFATVFVTFDNTNPNLTYLSMPSNNILVNYLIGGGAAPTGGFSLNDIFLGSTRLGSTSNATWTSDTVNKQRKTNTPRFATTVGNGHVKFLEFSNLFSLQLPDTNIFPGQNYSNVAIGLGDTNKKIFDLPSANINQTSIVIKKNGISTSEFTKYEYRSGFRVGSVFDNAMPQHMYMSKNGLRLVYVYSATTIKVYDKILSDWVLRGTFVGGSSLNSVSISNDGNIVCCSNNGGGGAIYVFRWNGLDYISDGQINLAYRAKVVISGDGNSVISSHTSSPSVGLSYFNGTSWVSRSVPSFGSGSVVKIDISEDGESIILGNSGATPTFAVYDWDGSSYIKRVNPTVNLTITPVDVRISSDGLLIGIIASSSPYLTIYKWNGTSWDLNTGYDGVIESIANISFIDNYTVLLNGQNYFYIFDFIEDIWVKRIITSHNIPSATFVLVSSDFEVFYGSTGTYVSWTKGLPFSRIIFNSPPALNDVITADYTVDGVHKTDQFVIDTSFAIQFGEGI